ncbi:unnamed protein product [Pelagomonas calceolata]|uniref:Uncharacterized protein n=1 Tax=Pelagomonas calceolata TaxID=35677 RepID=A0A8J2SWS3_9STRA|nr:unnamed protein product [Pelagomonas calceolata]
MAGRDAATGGKGAALAGDVAKMGAAESDGDAAPDRVLAAPAPDDFLPRNVLACLLYDGALVTKEHVRAAKRLAATSKAWAAVDDAWRATLRAEVEQGGWGPFLDDARFRVAFWNANVEDAKAFACHDPVLMSCVLMRGVTGGRAPFDVLDAAAATFLDATSGNYGAHAKVARMLKGRNAAAMNRQRVAMGGAEASGARDPLREVTFGPEGEVDEREAYLSRNPLWRAGYGRPEGEFEPEDIDKRLLRRQALMDSVNEFHWTHPGLAPRKCPLPPRTLGTLRFFLQWFDSATSWPLERSNVLETLWSFKDAPLNFGALHPIEAERWRVFLDTFPADGHEAMLAFYKGLMEALRAGEPPNPADMMPPPGLAESIYEEELLCEAKVRSTVPGVVPLWYGRPMVDEDPEIAAQAALAGEMVGAGQCSLM